MLEEMTYNPYLPLWFRMKVHNTLARAVDEDHIASEHLEAAERLMLKSWSAGQKALNNSAYMDQIRQELDAESSEEEELTGEEELADEEFEDEGELENEEEPADVEALLEYEKATAE
ncbi:hypothetical protein LTR36_005164 [Oleoguttula mirabilis]|uniref:Uncharacterized protein n=1 Tax=Oleoguttula mirabilis TaxID=1507867 RepID=A0AAV9JVZ0_9PEZI|nr:hypothetical protein LTR36_005164 [Oleoguttula mirabilis]